MSVTLLVGDLKYEWKLITWILFCKIILKDNLPFCSWKIKNGTLFCVLSIDYIIHDMENQCPFSQGSDISSLKKTFFMKGGSKCPTHCCYRPPDDNLPSVSIVSYQCHHSVLHLDAWLPIKRDNLHPAILLSRTAPLILRLIPPKWLAPEQYLPTKVHSCCDDATVSFPISSEWLTEGQHLLTGDKCCVLCIVVSETTDRAWLSLSLSHKHQNHYLIVIVKRSRWGFLCEDFILMTECGSSSCVIQVLDVSDKMYHDWSLCLLPFRIVKMHIMASLVKFLLVLEWICVFTVAETSGMFIRSDPQVS